MTFHCLSILHFVYRVICSQTLGVRMVNNTAPNTDVDVSALGSFGGRYPEVGSLNHVGCSTFFEEPPYWFLQLPHCCVFPPTATPPCGSPAAAPCQPPPELGVTPISCLIIASKPPGTMTLPSKYRQSWLLLETSTCTIHLFGVP